MLLYILRRCVSAFSVVVVTLIASFALFFLAPTDPAGVICGPRNCTPERIENIRQSLDLDKPAVEQLGLYLKGIAAGRTFGVEGAYIDCPAPCLGYSYTFSRPVTEMLAEAVPVTVSIVLGAAVVYVLVGVVAGSVAARRRGSPADRLVVGGTLVANSIPYFLVALVVALYFTFFPTSQYHPLLDNPVKWAGGLLAAWCTLGLVNAASYTRYSRASMIESLGEDYVRTARAKGISERRVVYRHGLRSALTPVATILGIDLAYQMTNAIFTESIFGLPGLGRLTIIAFYQYDLPVLMGSVLVGAVVLVLMNLVVDIVYTILDPRVRLS